MLAHDELQRGTRILRENTVRFTQFCINDEIFAVFFFYGYFRDLKKNQLMDG